MTDASPPPPPALEAPTTVTVQGKAVHLAAPASLTLAYEVRDALLVSHQRAYAAALGVCWPKLARHVPYRYDVLPYGGRVMEFLLAEGATYHEIMHAGMAAYKLLTASLVTAAEVSDVQDFSEAPQAQDSA